MILGIALTVMTLGAAGLIALPFLRSGAGGTSRRGQELADALQQNPRNVENWVALGDALTSVKRYQRAAVAYTQAMQLAPNNADYASRTGEAMVFAANGQVTPGAEAAFREAMRRDPG